MFIFTAKIKRDEMNNLDLWNFINTSLESNASVCLLVVADSSNSSPGKAGFKMAVAGNGSAVGTIGGGIMEFNLIEEAKEILSKNIPLTKSVTLHHSKETKHNSSGLICGGKQTVIFHCLFKEDLETVHKIINAIALGTKELLNLSNDGLSLGKLPPDFEEINYTQSDNDNWKYSEVIGFEDTIYIIGGGHVGLSLSKIMTSIGFRVVVLDHRENVSTVTQNSYANLIIILADYSVSSDHIPEGSKSYVAIVTSTHPTDKTALRSLLKKKLAYLGMMGSKRKIKKIFDELIEEGLGKNLFERVHSPIGLEIYAETTDEIAISIAAEIIRVKNLPKSTELK